LYVCLLLILSNKLDLNQETRFTIYRLKCYGSHSTYRTRIIKKYFFKSLLYFSRQGIKQAFACRRQGRVIALVISVKSFSVGIVGLVCSKGEHSGWVIVILARIELPGYSVYSIRLVTIANFGWVRGPLVKGKFLYGWSQ